MTNRLDAIKKNPKVSDCWHESENGYWVILNKGWQIDGCHGWREDKLSALKSSIRNAKPCNCRDCK